jgi:hypothetical protein
VKVRPFGRALPVLAAVALAPVAAGCGKKGPPLVPLRPVPAAVAALSVYRVGSEVHLRFVVPSRNADGTAPADLVRVEAYALTAPPADAQGRPLDDGAFLRLAARVAAVDIEPPPPPPPEEGPPPPPAAAPDPRPAQNEEVTLVETLSPDAVSAQAPAVARAGGPPAGLQPTRGLDPPTRVYVVTGRSRRGDAGPLSARVAVPLADPPDPPGVPVAQHDETRVRVTWSAPASLRLPVQAPVPAVAPPAGGASPEAIPPPPLAGRPVFGPAVPRPYTYNVYHHDPTTADATHAMSAPINPAPLETLSFEEPGVVFGVERCYVVRALEVHGAAALMSAASPPACLTPRDTFPPAAPRNLAAVGAAGAVNLIWEANTEPDLAGYLVLRGVAPGTALEALTPAPITETTFRDATAAPGVRYVYAVVAADNAAPQNLSVQSNRIEETAR